MQRAMGSIVTQRHKLRASHQPACSSMSAGQDICTL